MNEDNEVLYDERGFNEAGIHRDTGTKYDPDGWDCDGIHERTLTEFGLNGLTIEGSAFNADGYDEEGYDADGYNADGYDADGYNADGYDCNGDSRCANGDCEDPGCECHTPSFESALESYGCKAPLTHGWKPASPDLAALYVGHEIEMYSDDADPDDVAYTVRQVDAAYARFNPLTRSGRCAIAKHDGSLDDRDGGFELVTVPLTHEQVYGIFESFKTLGNGRCSAWDCGDDVGHHIHLTKRAIGPLTLGKLLVFMNADVNRPFLEAIAGREAGFNKFCIKKLTEVNQDRYEVLNVTDRTVEFRLFKSNLYSKAILKNHEFAIAAVRFCEQAAHGFGEVHVGTDPLHFINFRRFVAANRGAYKYLHEYMLAHPAIRPGYRNNSNLPKNVANPKDRSPTFALLRTTDVVGA